MIPTEVKVSLYNSYKTRNVIWKWMLGCLSPTYPHDECCWDVDARWMCGDTRLVKIRNDLILWRQVANIMDKMREARLRWVGHVLSRPIDAPVLRCGTVSERCYKGTG